MVLEVDEEVEGLVVVIVDLNLVWWFYFGSFCNLLRSQFLFTPIHLLT